MEIRRVWHTCNTLWCDVLVTAGEAEKREKLKDGHSKWLRQGRRKSSIPFLARDTKCALVKIRLAALLLVWSEELNTRSDVIEMLLNMSRDVIPSLTSILNKERGEGMGYSSQATVDFPLAVCS